MRTKLLNRITNHKLYNSRAAHFARAFMDIFISKNIARSAAALSYYITISVFPLLICVTAILGSLHITETELFEIWYDIIPSAAIEVIGEFLGYISGNISSLMLIVGLVTMFTTSSAAFRTIVGIMSDVQGERRFKGFWGHLVSFAASGVFLIVIYASGLVILTGEWFINFLREHFVLDGATDIWLWARFLLLFGLILLIFYGAYNVSAPRHPRGAKRNSRKYYCLPGALIAALIVVIASAVFSRLISASTKYAIVYGSLASIVIMMVWIYTCALIFLLGNVFNVAYSKRLEGV